MGDRPSGAVPKSSAGSRTAVASPRRNARPDYCFPPDYAVLRNRLDIRHAAAPDTVGRELVALRLLELVRAGDFDLNHLKAIHCHLSSRGGSSLPAWLNCRIAGAFLASRW